MCRGLQDVRKRAIEAEDAQKERETRLYRRLCLCNQLDVTRTKAQQEALFAGCERAFS
jgi:hypothetical protein